MTTRLSIFLIFTSLLLFTFCSSERSVRRADGSGELDELYIQDVKLKVNEIYSWVNLMPGAEPRFHITGNVDLLKSIKYDFRFVELVSVIVYHDNKKVYSISPVVKELESEQGDSKNIRFSTIRGLLINRELDIDKDINIDLVFNDGDDELIYMLDNIKINKAY
jgi:hypothetical protein